jgi:hypothetical protein
MEDKMSAKEGYQMIVKFAYLVESIASLESLSLDIRDLLEYMPPEGRADVGDELQQVADLSKAIAEKLEIAPQVQAIRNMQEAKLQSDKALRKSYDEAIISFKNMGRKDGEEG